jgi:CubicO group peptidase (beta-lactamase class C family)
MNLLLSRPFCPLAFHLLAIGKASDGEDARMRFRALGSLGLVTTLVLATPSLPAQTPRALSPATPESQGLSSEALAELAAAVARYVDEGAIVGGELLVVKNHHTVLHKAFGWRDREAAEPMRPGTIFNLRSMTKPLVGAAAQILIDEGKLAPDQRVAELLPGFANERSREITVEQLMTHRAGLPLTILTGLHDYPDLQALGNAVGERGPETPPGSGFAYSDASADALGAVVERAAGMPLDKFLRTRLLDPLGMGDTFAAAEPDDPRWSRVASLYARPSGEWQRFWKPQGESLYPFLLGSQGLYGTAMDYARFLVMWLDGGMGGSRRLLSKAAVARTLTPVSIISASNSALRMPTGFPGLEVAYGQMAVLHVREGAGSETPVVVVGHSGSDGTSAWAWPERDLMVLYFTQSRGNLTSLRLERAIARLLLHEEGRSVVRDERAYEPYLGTYVGNFGPFRNAEFNVRVQDGFLALEVPGRFVTELNEPDDQGRWAFRLLGKVAVSFERAADGGVVAMHWHEGGATFVLPRGHAVPEAVLMVEDVERYLGRYEDPSTHTIVELVFVNGGLAAKLPGVAQPIEFSPPDAQGFWAVRANALLRISFNENADGQVVSYTVHGPDGSTSVRPRLGKPD